MRARLRRGKDEVAARIQQALCLATKKQSKQILDAVIDCIEATLLNNLGADGFTIKLNNLGKFSVRHKAGILRKIPFTGEVKQTPPKRKVRFVPLGTLRQCERVT